MVVLPLLMHPNKTVEQFVNSVTQLIISRLLQPLFPNRIEHLKHFGILKYDIWRFNLRPLRRSLLSFCCCCCCCFSRRTTGLYRILFVQFSTLFSVKISSRSVCVCVYLSLCEYLSASKHGKTMNNNNCLC